MSKSNHRTASSSIAMVMDDYYTVGILSDLQLAEILSGDIFMVTFCPSRSPVLTARPPGVVAEQGLRMKDQ